MLPSGQEVEVVGISHRAETKYDCGYILGGRVMKPGTGQCGRVVLTRAFLEKHGMLVGVPQGIYDDVNARRASNRSQESRPASGPVEGNSGASPLKPWGDVPPKSANPPGGPLLVPLAPDTVF